MKLALVHDASTPERLQMPQEAGTALGPSIISEDIRRRFLSIDLDVSPPTPCV
jgi:hypothetical protein